MTIYSWVSQTKTKSGKTPEEEEAAALARERRMSGKGQQPPEPRESSLPSLPAALGNAPDAPQQDFTRDQANQPVADDLDDVGTPRFPDFSETETVVDTGDVDGDGRQNDDDATPYGEHSEPPQQSDFENLDDHFSAEQQALEDEFAAQEAQALLDTRARSGAAGFGTSGAQQGMETDIRRVMGREEVLALAELARGYRDEGRSNAELDIVEQQAENRDRQFELAMMQLETEMGADLNDDGVIGVGVDAESPDEREADETRAELNTLYATVGGTGADNDEYGGFNGMSAGQLESLVAAGAQFTITSVYSDGFGGMNVEARDQFGNMIKVEVPSDQDDNEDTATEWFNSVTGG